MGPWREERTSARSSSGRRHDSRSGHLVRTRRREAARCGHRVSRFRRVALSRHAEAYSPASPILDSDGEAVRGGQPKPLDPKREGNRRTRHAQGVERSHADHRHPNSYRLSRMRDRPDRHPLAHEHALPVDAEEDEAGGTCPSGQPGNAESLPEVRLRQGSSLPTGLARSGGPIPRRRDVCDHTSRLEDRPYDDSRLVRRFETDDPLNLTQEIVFYIWTSRCKIHL